MRGSIAHLRVFGLVILIGAVPPASTGSGESSDRVGAALQAGAALGASPGSHFAGAVRSDAVAVRSAAAADRSAISAPAIAARPAGPARPGAPEPGGPHRHDGHCAHCCGGYAGETAPSEASAAAPCTAGPRLRPVRDERPPSFLTSPSARPRAPPAG